MSAGRLPGRVRAQLALRPDQDGNRACRWAAARRARTRWPTSSSRSSTKSRAGAARDLPCAAARDARRPTRRSRRRAAAHAGLQPARMRGVIEKVAGDVRAGQAGAPTAARKGFGFYFSHAGLFRRSGRGERSPTRRGRRCTTCGSRATSAATSSTRSARSTRSQGSVIDGLGQALALAVDDRGRRRTKQSNFHDYPLPRIAGGAEDPRRMDQVGQRPSNT